MAISPKMLAVLQKVDAARAELLAGLRESAKREEQARTKKRTASRAAASLRKKAKPQI